MRRVDRKPDRTGFGSGRIPYKDPSKYPLMAESKLRSNRDLTRTMIRFRVEVLHMKDEGDRKHYAEIREGVHEGYNIIEYISREWDSDEKNWIILIEWGILYKDSTEDATKSMKEKTSKHLSG